MEKKEINEYLLNFLTEKRKKRLLEVLELRTRYITIVLENIYDPHNGSACLRSCEANGIQDVYIIERENQFSTKEGVSMGSGKWLNLYNYSSKHYQEPSKECFQELINKGYEIIGVSPIFNSQKQFISLNEFEVLKPTAFVFGSEKDGLSNFSKNYIDTFIYIPMYGFVESYNISVACAILVYTLTQQIRKKEIDWKIPQKEKEEILYHWLKKSIKHSDNILSSQF